ncbi:MAG: Ig-like domain-containing protein, partial [Proteobacteria bacterium]|nr:Ig-like domain-containing protein [Pseudomonadota bacterium]
GSAGACQIGGTPDTAGRNVLRLRADTAEGSSTVLELTFIVRQDNTLDFTPDALTKAVGDDVFTNAVTSADTAAVITWVSTAPDVASVDADSGAVTTLTVGLATITATSAQNDEYKPASASYALTVNPALPDLQDPSAQTFATGAAANLSLTNDGGGLLNAIGGSPSGCVVSSALPSGLALTVSDDRTTCTISGTISGAPGTTQGATDYTVTATNVTGSDSTPAVVSIAIVSGVAAFADPGLLTYTDGTSIGNQVFANTNTSGDVTAITNCAPATGTMLPAGLTIAAQGAPDNGCVLSGTPMAPTDADFYSIVATNMNGASTLTLNIVVNPAAPDLQVPANQIFATGADAALTLTNNGGGLLNANNAMVAGCTVAPDLPAGLILAVSADGNSCTISGEPTEAVVANDYVVTATNATTASSATVGIAVVLGTPTLVAPGSLSFIADTSIMAVNILNVNTHPDAGRVTDCRAVALLPTGLTIAALDAPGDGCVLSGTPEGFMAQGVYAVRVVNDNDSAGVLLMLDITVNRQTYTLSFVAGDLTRSLDAADFISAFTASPVDVTDAVIWTSSDEDVATVNAATGEVAIATIGTTVITVSRAQDSVYEAGSASYTLTVNPVAPVFGSFDGAVTAMRDAAVAVDLPLDGDAVLTAPDGSFGQCDFVADADTSNPADDTLAPVAGLTVARTDIDPGTNNGCRISGTPVIDALVTSTATVTAYVRAQNVVGSAYATVVFTVNPPSPILTDPAQTQIFGVGDTALIELANTGGTDLSACTISTGTAPAGLMPEIRTVGGRQSCVIAGTANTATVADATITVTATNAGGMGTADVTIRVVRQTYTLAFASGSVTRTVGDAAFTTLYSASPNVGTDAVIWTSSDLAVATVDSATGEVTIVAIGTTTIRATRAQDAVYEAAEASYALTVNPVAPVFGSFDGAVTAMRDAAVTVDLPLDGDAVLTAPDGGFGQCDFVADADTSNPA